jgi:hypothetical protein
METDRSPHEVIADAIASVSPPAGDWDGTPPAEVVIRALAAAGWKIVRAVPAQPKSEPA